MESLEGSRIPLVRFVFFGAVLFALIMACLPQPILFPGQPFDKVQHAIAFAVLTLLAHLSYPTVKSWRIVVSLAALGALFEAAQAMPVVNRDASLLDWLADCGAVLGVTATRALAAKRRGSDPSTTSAILTRPYADDAKG